MQFVVHRPDGTTYNAGGSGDREFYPLRKIGVNEYFDTDGPAQFYNCRSSIQFAQNMGVGKFKTRKLKINGETVYRIWRIA